MKKLFILLLATLSLQATQIQSIKFVGLMHLSPQMAEEISGLKVGEPLTYNASNEAIKELFKQGYFEDISIDDDNGNITIYVTEKPTIAVIEVTGISEDDKKVIKDILGISKGMVYDNNSFLTAKNRIIKFYEAKGYFDTVVETKTEPLQEKTSLKLIFQVNRGENIIITSVKLPGADELDYDDIEPYVANKQREIFGWMWGFNDGVLKLPELPNDPGKIKDEYLRYGFLDVNVSNPFLRVNYDTYNATLIYRINEGSQYKIGNISFVYPDKLIDANETKDDLILQEGDVFNIKKLRRDMKNVETQVADLGYAFVKIYPDIKQNKENHTVDVTYTILPGDQVYINDVIIGGNTKTADNVVRRDIYLSKGQLYNRTELKETKDTLKRTGYFEDVTIKEKRVSKDTVDLLVTVEEKPTGNIRGGVGYGSSDGFLFDIAVSDKNLFGSGIHGIANMSRSNKKLSGRIGITNPRVYDSPYSLGGSIYAEDYDYSSYDMKTYGFSIASGRKITKHSRISLEYILEQNDLSKLNNDLKEIGYEEGKTVKSSITPSYTFNNTDDYYLPRRGIIASTALEYAGIGGDEKFIKSTSSFKIFYGLEDMVDYDLILRYKAKLRYVWDRGFLPINERLYLGGVGSVRGFKSRSIGPKRNDHEFGGTKSFSNSVEASFPLISRLKMRGALFVDLGMVGEHNFDDFVRSSAGISLEWISPLGAISLIFAKPINDKPEDKLSSFEFTIGRQF